MKDILHKIIDTIGDIIRLYIKTKYVRSPGSRVITAGLTILLILFGANVVGAFGINVPGLVIVGSISTPETPTSWGWVLLGLAVVLILGGATWLFRTEALQRKSEAEENDRKVVLIVQVDAYNEVIPPPLSTAVPADIKGRRIPVLIQKRDALVAGNSLQESADEVMLIKRQLLQNAGGRDLNDISVCAGGLAPVPLLFLLGNVLEDDRPIYWADWERNEKRWAWSREGVSVKPWGLPKLSSMFSSEVVLKSGVTYPIADEDVARVFPNLHVVKWEPADRLFQTIIDEHSCRAICDEFKALMHLLLAHGVKRVHFLLACSSALTMRLGSVLDPRNMPEVIVYQYERNSALVYTWGIGVRAHEGRKTPIIIDHRTS